MRRVHLVRQSGKVSVNYIQYFKIYCVISPQKCGEKSGFYLSFCLGGNSLSEMPGEKVVLGRNKKILILPGGVTLNFGPKIFQ